MTANSARIAAPGLKESALGKVLGSSATFSPVHPNLRKVGGNCVSLSDMNSSHRHQPPFGLTGHSSRKPELLSEQRYQDLLKNASAFFAAADASTDDERQAAIHEIIELMSRYGLTANDLN